MTLCYSHRREDPFVRLHLPIVRNPNISLKAKALMAYAFSRPVGWSFYVYEIEKHCTDGKKSIRSGLRELEKAGYLHRRSKRDENNKFCGIEWHFTEDMLSEEEFKKMFAVLPISGKARNGSDPKGHAKKIDSKKKDIKKNIETTNVVSCPSPKKVTDTAPKQIQFNRKSREFDGLDDKKLLKLKETYPNLDISQEIGKMKLWLEENPKGKRRKGTWRFILDWISRTSEQYKFSTDKQFKSLEDKGAINSNELKALGNFFSFYDSWYDNLMDKFLADRGKVVFRNNKLSFFGGEKEYLATTKNLSWMLEKCCVPYRVIDKAKQMKAISA